MPHEFIDEQVDIFQLPVLDVPHKGNTGIQITIGDLHGNAMKLMFMLVKHGIATNIDEADYNRLVAIYKTPKKDLTKKHLDEFNQILSKIKFSKDSLVRLIGDELADRGNNDYFTLKILEKLNEHKVPVEIIVSNHSIEFIEACEKQDDFHAPMLSQGHAQSMEKLQILVEKGIVARDEILAIANKSYKPTLRAISYSLSEDKKEITIYSHAGIGLNTIKSLAQKLKVEYKDATASELAQTIDSINVQFQKHVQNNTVNTLYAREKMYEGYYSINSDLSDAPLEFIMWNRLYHHIDRLAVHSGYNVNFVHGHDSSDPTKDNIYNLDNALGKMEDMNQGAYTVLYSREGEMAPVVRPLEIEEIDVQQQVKKEIKSTVITLSELHQYFLSQLKDIKAKEKELRSNGHTVAADYAKDLYKTIKNKHKKLTEEKINIQTFKNSCTDAIKIARPELEKHRGWKQVLGNLALAVVGIGVLYVIAGLINKAVTGNFLFFKTDSANKIDQLEQSVKSINSPK
jgi:hypothetical protein